MQWMWKTVIYFSKPLTLHLWAAEAVLSSSSKAQRVNYEAVSTGSKKKKKKKGAVT